MFTGPSKSILPIPQTASKLWKACNPGLPAGWAARLAHHSDHRPSPELQAWPSHKLPVLRTHMLNTKGNQATQIVLRERKVSHIPSPGYLSAPCCRLRPQPLQMAACTMERQFRISPPAPPALGCNWIQAETTTSPPGKEGFGAGAGGAAAGEGRDQRREAKGLRSPTKQKKDQKTEKRRTNRLFQNSPSRLPAGRALGTQKS